MSLIECDKCADWMLPKDDGDLRCGRCGNEWLKKDGQTPTLRDQFAMTAMTGLLSDIDSPSDSQEMETILSDIGYRVGFYVRCSYIVADAMLEARKEPK